MVMAITFITVLTDTTLIQETLSTFNQVEVVSSVPSLVFAFVSASLLVSGAASLVNVVAVAVVEMMVEMMVELSSKNKLLLLSRNRHKINKWDTVDSHKCNKCNNNQWATVDNNKCKCNNNQWVTVVNNKCNKCNLDSNNQWDNNK